MKRVWADSHSKESTTNHAFLAHCKRLTSKLLSRNTKLKLHKTLLRRILTCGSESGTITAEETNELRIFEEKDCKENMWTRKRRKRLDNNKDKEIREVL